MYCLWPLPCILLVCTTLVCVLFVATTTYTISVYEYYLVCTTLVCVLFVDMYCLWPLLFVCPTIVLVCIVYTTPITLVKCTSQLPIHVLDNSVSVYYFYYYILKLYLPPPRGEESPWTTVSHWREKQTNFSKQIFSAPLISSRIGVATFYTQHILLLSHVHSYIVSVSSAPSGGGLVTWIGVM